jgi:hypothetical protein
MGVVLGAGEPVRVESDKGAVVIVVEAPRLVATSRAIGKLVQYNDQTSMVFGGTREVLQHSQPIGNARQ